MAESPETIHAWRVTRHGRPTLALDLLEVGPPEPPGWRDPGRPTHSVCNYNEVDGCHGRYLTINPPLPYTLGMEFVGDVVGAGPGAEPWVGRHVMGTGKGATGAHAEARRRAGGHGVRRTPEAERRRGRHLLLPVPPGPPGPARAGHLQAGETVLVHAAAGGVGSAAVQLAKAARTR